MISNKDRRYIKIALKLALNADGKHRLGAVVVKGGRILGKGYNVYARLMHAEYRALNQNWKSELKGATLYVARALRCTVHGMARPCPKCQQLIKEMEIDKVIFTTSDPQNPIAIERF